MKRSIEVYNGRVYVYDLFKVGKKTLISVDKDDEGKETYLITKYRGKYICSCPGARYHKHCHHEDFVASCRWTRMNEPWCEWAQEAMEMRFGN